MSKIKIKDIHESELNPRKSFPEESIKELAESIEAQGLLQPIIVRKNDSGYELVVGARRLRALQLLERTEVEASIVEATDEQAMEMMIVENMQRENVHPMDEAVAMKDLYKLLKSYKRVATALGVSQTYVSRRIKLNDLIPEWEEKFRVGEIYLSEALLICLGDKDFQENLDDWNVNPENIKRALTGDMCNLSRCNFDPADKNLVPKAGKNGSCIGCKSNTATDTLLFADALKDAHCKDPKCFEKKTKAVSKAIIKDIKEKAPDFIKVTSKWYSEDESVLKSEDWKEIKDHTKRGEWNEEEEEYEQIEVEAFICPSAKKAVVVEDELAVDVIDVCTNKKCEHHWRVDNSGKDSSIPNDELKHEGAKRKLAKRWEKEDKSDRKQAREATLEAIWEKKGKLTVTEMKIILDDVIGSLYGKRINAALGLDTDQEDNGYHSYDWDNKKKVIDSIQSEEDFAYWMRRLMTANHVDDTFGDHRIDQKETELGQIAESHKVKISDYFKKYQKEREKVREEQTDAVDSMKVKWKVKEKAAKNLVKLIDQDESDKRTDELGELKIPVILANNLQFGVENFKEFVKSIGETNILEAGHVVRLAKKLNLNQPVPKGSTDSDVVDMVWDRIVELRG